MGVSTVLGLLLSNELDIAPDGRSQKGSQVIYGTSEEAESEDEQAEEGL